MVTELQLVQILAPLGAFWTIFVLCYYWFIARDIHKNGKTENDARFDKNIINKKEHKP